MSTRSHAYSSSFKAMVALSAQRSQRPLTELAREFGLPPQLVEQWQEELMTNAFLLFEKQVLPTPAPTHGSRLLWELKIFDDFQAGC